MDIRTPDKKIKKMVRTWRAIWEDGQGQKGLFIGGDISSEDLYYCPWYPFLVGVLTGAYKDSENKKGFIIPGKMPSAASSKWNFQTSNSGIPGNINLKTLKKSRKLSI